MGERRDKNSAAEPKPVSLEAMRVRTRDVLVVLDRVLRGEAEVSEAYLLARDVVSAVNSGIAVLDDEHLLAPLRTLAEAKAINRELIEEIRGHLGSGTDAGTA